MAMIELVDFNELYNPNEEEKKTTRRSRRAGTAKKEAVASVPAAETPAEEAKTDGATEGDRKSTRLNSSHVKISYAVFCLKKKTKLQTSQQNGRPYIWTQDQ